MLSIALDFVLSRRCQVADNSLQPGGIMLFGASSVVGNRISMTSAVRLFKTSVIARELWGYALVWAPGRNGLSTLRLAS